MPWASPSPKQLDLLPHEIRRSTPLRLLLEEAGLTSVTVEEKNEFVQNVSAQQDLMALVIASDQHA
jgi:hypothetical protein